MKILALSGSLQAVSTNTALLHAARAVAAPGTDVVVFESLADLPHFNPDLDGDTPPAAVVEFRAQLASSDGVLIASPEYAHSMPGALKDALDWIVGSGELYGKPVALVSASPRPDGAGRGRAALEQTLRAQGARVVTSFTVQVVPAQQIDAAEDASVREHMADALHALTVHRGEEPT